MDITFTKEVVPEILIAKIEETISDATNIKVIAVDPEHTFDTICEKTLSLDTTVDQSVVQGIIDDHNFTTAATDVATDKGQQVRTIPVLNEIPKDKNIFLGVGSVFAKEETGQLCIKFRKSNGDLVEVELATFS